MDLHLPPSLLLGRRPPRRFGRRQSPWRRNSPGRRQHPGGWGSRFRSGIDRIVDGIRERTPLAALGRWLGSGPPTDSPRPTAPAFLDRLREPDALAAGGRSSLLAMRRRLLPLGIGCALFLALIAGRLFHLQILCHRGYLEMATAQQERRVTVRAVRGDVVDREGRVLLHTLACRTLVACPREISRGASAARRLAPVIGRSEGEIARLLAKRAPLVELDPQVNEREATRIRALRLPGLQLVEAGRRVKLVEGCDLLGALDHQGRGNEGIERSMDAVLRGEDGWETRYVDARGRLAARPDARAKPAVDGDRVMLTIDSRWQWAAEDALRRAVAEHRARGGSAVLVETTSGEVLALASVGTSSLGAGRRVDRLAPIEDTYEPGSTFKLITFAAAIDLGLIDEDAVFFAENGRANFGGFEIRDAKKLGWLCAADVLAFSSNIATAKIGQMVGARELYQAARRFGFGRRTGIELPGEAAGSLRPVEEWSGRSLPTIAIGQELGATTLQLAMAYGALANSGELKRPRIVRRIVAPDGEIRATATPETVRRTMLPATAAIVTRYMVRAVEIGTGKRAAISGVAVAGKTGTAQKARIDGRGYAQGKFVSSFVGIFPADAPRYVLAVSIDEPAGMHYGGEVAAPVFREIAMATLGPARLPQGMREVETAELAPSSRLSVPDVRLLSPRAAVRRLRDAGFEARVIAGGDRVLSQDPLPGEQVSAGTMVTLGRSPAKTGTVPELHGLALRDALRLLRGSGIEMRAAGFGWVADQSPPAGTPVSAGMVCRIVLAPDRGEWRGGEPGEAGPESSPESPAAEGTGEEDVRGHAGDAATIPVALASDEKGVDRGTR